MNLPSTSRSSSSRPTRSPQGWSAARQSSAQHHARLVVLRDLVAQGLYRVPTEILAERLVRSGVLGPFLASR